MTPEELYKKIQGVDTGVCHYTLDKCAEFTPLINRIQELKKEKNAVILAHSYISSEILYGVADYVGDSYYLSDIARKVDAELIVFVAVRFMAETAKILNPNKRVISPNDEGGCSLADSITADQVRELKKQHSDRTFVCYINTTAEVKAECDVCVTSSNVDKIIEKIDNEKIFFLPDRLMAKNISESMAQKGIKKDIISSEGSCYVHETYDPEMIDYIRVKNENLAVAVHPECAPGVVHKADYVGSTAGIFKYVKESSFSSYLLLTECGLSSRVQAELKDKKIVGSCTFCKYMQGNSLGLIKEALEKDDGKYEIEIGQDMRERASACIDKMFELAG